MLYLNLFTSIATIACTIGRFAALPTGTLILEEICGTFQAMRDNCSSDGNSLVKIRAPQDHYYIDCNNGNPICLSCAANLHWSPKCQQCEYYKNDTLNECSPSLFGVKSLPTGIIPGVSENSENAFTESKSPYDGHCNISPNNGTSLETTFTILCQDWKSSVGPLQYRVWLHRQANEDKFLSFGSVPEFHLLLAAGDESTRYMVNITVEIIDLHKASTSFQLYVQVFPSVESTQELLFNLTSGENSKFDELSAKDGTQGLVQLINILGESMNKEQGQEAENETTVNGTKTEALQQRTQVRSTIVEALAKADIQSSENVIQIANTLAVVLSSPEEVTKKTKELALQSFSQMTKFLVAESKEGNIPSEEIEETSTAILLGLSAFTDSQEAVEASINQTGNVTVDIDTSDITLSSSIKKEASITRETLEKAIQKASSAASANLVTGEKPTSIETARFNSVLSKQNLADLNGLKISKSSSNSLDVFDGLSLTKVKAENNTDNLNSLNISAPSFNSLYLSDGLNFTNNKAKNNTDDLNVLNLNIVETNITSNSSSIISLLKLFDLGNSSRIAD